MEQAGRPEQDRGWADAARGTARGCGRGEARGRSTPGGFHRQHRTAARRGGGLKREPKGGVQPYSDEALARLRQPEGAKPIEKTADKPSEKPADKPAEKTPAAVPTGDATDWAWPYGGTLTTPFSEGGSKGIDLSGKAGDAVNAAAAGRVNYVGTGIRGYGNLVIVKHDATYLSVYAHNSKILVKEGQTVSKGQKIAEVGSSDADSPKLHFEIRKQGKPVDPLAYLPKR